MWQISRHPAVQQALRNAYFDSIRLPRLAKPWNTQLSRTAVYVTTYARWCDRDSPGGLSMSINRFYRSWSQGVWDEAKGLGKWLTSWAAQIRFGSKARRYEEG
jgi:hypothetical protein